MTLRIPFDDQDKLALHALDPDFAIDPSGEIATITGRMKIKITRIGERLRLEIEFPNALDKQMLMRRFYQANHDQ